MTIRSSRTPLGLGSRDLTEAMTHHLELPRVTVFGPDALLSVTIESGGEGDEVHVHAAGQGVWVAMMAAELETGSSAIKQHR